MRTIFITGKGRSGTTWLAAVMGRYRHCSYKHEPFLPGKNTLYTELRAQLGKRSPSDIQALYQRAIARAFVSTDLPPFDARPCQPQPNWMRRVTYELGKRMPPLAPLYGRIGRAHLDEGTDILIKDVNFPNELLAPLCEAIDPWLIGVVRNPFANVASFLRGVATGHFSAPGPRDFARVRELLATEPDDSLRRHATNLEQLPPYAFEAVRWRLQTEPLVRFVHTHARARLVVYDDLVQDPMPQLSTLFAWIGWPFDTEIQAFVESSRHHVARRGRQDFYAVHRAPLQSQSRWRKDLAEADVQAIARVVDESPIRQLWPDLPTLRARHTH